MRLLFYEKGTQKMFKSKSQKILSGVVFGVYFALLVWLVLFKLHINIVEVSHVRTLNLIPFRFDMEAEISVQLKEVLYNVLVFIPLGVYVNMYRHPWFFWKKIIPCLSVSFLFELLQFVFALGVSDITDLITNTLGGIIGILLYALFRKIFHEKSITIINLLGAGMELFAILLLAVLLLANG